MKESRCRWGEAPWKRVGGSREGSSCSDRQPAHLHSTLNSLLPLPPFLYRAHVKARRGNSQLPWDWPQQHFSPFFYILTFRSFEVSDGVFFFWYFHFRNFESESVGGASGLEGLTRPKPRSPLGHLSPELMSAIQLTETKTSPEPINRNFFVLLSAVQFWNSRSFRHFHSQAEVQLCLAILASNQSNLSPPSPGRAPESKQLLPTWQLTRVKCICISLL